MCVAVFTLHFLHVLINTNFTQQTPRHELKTIYRLIVLGSGFPFYGIRLVQVSLFNGICSPSAGENVLGKGEETSRSGLPVGPQ